MDKLEFDEAARILRQKAVWRFTSNVVQWSFLKHVLKILDSLL